MQASLRFLSAVLLALAGTMACLPAGADELPEYRLKAAFVFNFVVYTEWPAGSSGTLNICTVGDDPFGKELDGLQGKTVDGRNITVRRKGASRALGNCDVVFVASSAMPDLPHVLDALKGHATLTIADSPGAAEHGVMLNMAVTQDRITFEANQHSARDAGLVLSSRLLKLATEVIQ